MPLVKVSMQSAFLAMFNSNPDSRTTVAQKWAMAYDSYASLAITANGGTFIPTGGMSTIQGLLVSPLQAGKGPAVAAAWGTAMLAYWAAHPFGPGAIPSPPFTLPGIAIPPTGVTALISGLTDLYAGTQSGSDFAQQHASLLDTCTQTVMVAFGPVTVPVM